MEIIRGVNNFPARYRGNVHLALGNFDGVHRGHQEVVYNAIKSAHKNDGISAALIFQPHPGKVINPHGNLMLLSDLEMKSEILAVLGLDCLITEPFNLKVASLSPETFFKFYLLNKIAVKSLATGFDYSFGSNAGGTIEDLQKWGKEYGFEMLVKKPVKIKDSLISSSLIRNMIRQGNVEEASLFLNYYFYRRGLVVPGDGRGKKLGFPTANLKISSELILPGNGVYFTALTIDGKKMFGATNIGKRPTFSKDDQTVEVHVMDYKGDLYGKNITVFFLKKIRDEIAFPGAETLVGQLKEDIECCRKLSRSFSEHFKTGLIERIDNE